MQARHPRRARFFLWFLTRTLWTRRDTPKNRAKCEASRFIWGTPPGKKRIHMRVLGFVNGFMDDGQVLTIFYDEDDKPVAADVRPIGPVDEYHQWGDQLPRKGKR